MDTHRLYTHMLYCTYNSHTFTLIHIHFDALSHTHTHTHTFTRRQTVWYLLKLQTHSEHALTMGAGPINPPELQEGEERKREGKKQRKRD